MIIAFSGRIGSGKSELAKICQNKGFEKLYFALPLKQLVANLIHVGIEDINPLKNVEKKYKFTKNSQKISALHLTLLKIVIQYKCNENYIYVHTLETEYQHIKNYHH